jgi:hypothetical protein
MTASSSEEALRESQKAGHEEDEQPRSPALYERRKQRFKSLTVDEHNDLETRRPTSQTIQYTKWGVKILQGRPK